MKSTLWSGKGGRESVFKTQFPIPVNREGEKKPSCIVVRKYHFKSQNWPVFNPRADHFQEVCRKVLQGIPYGKDNFPSQKHLLHVSLLTFALQWCNVTTTYWWKNIPGPPPHLSWVLLVGFGVNRMGHDCYRRPEGGSYNVHVCLFLPTNLSNWESHRCDLHTHSVVSHVSLKSTAKRLTAKMYLLIMRGTPKGHLQ